jgi:hypothetical protein
VTRFVESKSITFPSVLYVGAVTGIESDFGLSGEIPVTIVFDARGRELSRVEGIIDEKKFRAELDRLLAPSRRPTK